MKLSTDRMLTTHVGSLPRPPDLLAFLEARETGRELDQARFDGCLAASVDEIVKKQVAAGIDRVCDGELGKISYTFYVRHRLSGITAFQGGHNDQPPQTAAHRDLLDHPDYMQRLNQARGGTAWFSREAVPCCTGPVEYRDRRPLDTDLMNLTAACAAAKPVEAFMNAASPGVLTKFVPDRHYRDEDAYIDALANALREEYEAIAKAGFILQIDAPDLGSARQNQYDARQPAATMVRFDGLCTGLRSAPRRPSAYPIRPRQLRHDPPQATEDRRPGTNQRAPHQARHALGLSLSGRVPRRPCRPQWPLTRKASKTFNQCQNSNRARRHSSSVSDRPHDPPCAYRSVSLLTELSTVRNAG
jgi:5-methyltetrahydropteroyltriglutamate--homocysteine methyltransferase